MFSQKFTRISIVKAQPDLSLPRYRSRIKGLDKKKNQHNIVKIFLSNILRFALGVQKNRLIYCINK